MTSLATFYEFVKIAHFYFGIDYQIVWSITKEKLPEIKPAIIPILKDIKASESSAK